MKTKLIQKIKEELRDKFYESCKGRFNCGRDWEAWQIGTMTVDDFSPLEEDDDFIDELSEIAIKAISQSKQELVEEIKEQFNKEPFTTQDEYNPDLFRNYIGTKELNRFLEDLNKK